MIFIIHSSIINDKIVWCKWLNNLCHFTAQNASNYTIIWLKSFCLLKSTTWTLPINPNFIPFVSEANSSPPSSMNHRLLFVKPMKRGAQGGGDGMRKGEEPTTKWGWERLLFPTKNKDICYKQMSFYASNICVMVANAVSNCYKRRCSGSLRCSSLIML